MSFPTSSTEQVTLHPTKHFECGTYNLKGLGAVIEKAASENASKVNPPVQAAVDDNLFHLHTLTVQCSLEPPPETVEYHDGRRRNADYTFFNKNVEVIQKTVNAFTPLPIVQPTADILVIPLKPSRFKIKPPDTDYTANVIIPGVQRPFLQLPSILPENGRSFFVNNKAWDTLNWLHAALSLNPAQPPIRRGIYKDAEKEHIHLRTGVQLVWVPGAETNNAELKAMVTIDAYLNMSFIDTPLPEVGTDLFRMILGSLIPQNIPAPAETGVAARAAALRDFYDGLQPPPSFPEGFDDNVLQPRELITKLLPFQKRTVALLLHNEGSPNSSSDHVRTCDGQWSEVDFKGFGKYAFRRFTGELRQITHDRKGKGRATDAPEDPLLDLPSLFSLEKVRGTMLCEEMGLGKTMEATALIMLHRHPLSVPRPTMYGAALTGSKSYEVNLGIPPPGHDLPFIQEWAAKEHEAFANAMSWSPEVELNVREVGATLIVTPQPLLNQWITELATHAPTLRVCVYPGWSGLIEQVQARRKAAVKVRMAREAASLKRKNAKFVQATRAKYARGREGRIPVEQESEDESDDDDDADESLDTLLQATQRAWLEYVHSHDIVITTYQTLGKDLNVAHPAPKRSRRSNAKYNLEERPRSPLVMVEWWRVVMDEVQLQGDQSNAANMVSLIPRKCSLAVSGTPARTDTDDLIGSLRFLRVPDVGGVIWRRLLHHHNRPAFHGLFRHLAVRTTKVQVAHEFSIPQQTRYIVPIELSEIERHYYNDTLERQRERLLGSLEGDTFNSNVFRSSLRHLRQICTHIQVGALQRGAQAADRGDRIELGQVLLTMEQALTKMRHDVEQKIVDSSKKQIRELIRLGSLFSLKEDEPDHTQKALDIFKQAQGKAEQLLETARAHLATLNTDREDSVDLEKAKEAAVSKAERDRLSMIISASSLVREVLGLVHEARFLQGDCYHVLGMKKEEEEAYGDAEGLRKQLLSRPLKAANATVDALRSNLEKKAVLSDLDDLLMEKPNLKGAIYTADSAVEANALLEILNDNATLVFNWRDKLIELLQQPIDAEETTMPSEDAGEGQDATEPETDYYAKALQTQGETQAYFTAYAAAIADRKEMLHEQRTLLEVTDARITKKRTTRRAQEAAEEAALLHDEDVDEVKILTEDLMRERQAFRDRREENDCTRPLKAILIEVNNITQTAHRQEEIAIASSIAKVLRRFINQQTDYLEKLNKELDQFRTIYNNRLKYYSALQKISDSVQAYVPQGSIRTDMNNTERALRLLEAELATIAGKARYLSTLEDDKLDVHESCAVCFGTSDDKFAVLLNCGHSMCCSCFDEYRKADHIGTKCATCMAPIGNGKFKSYRIRGDEPTAEEGEGGPSEQGEARPSEQGEAGPSEQQGSVVETAVEEDAAEVARRARRADWKRLKLIDDDRRDRVASLDVMGQYGSKITVLMQHLHLWRLTQPKVRHVVFSNWADSLHIVERALKLNNIKYVSFDANSKNNDVVEQFHADPSILVFLLHAERESAGLTLTSCGVVHLLEPVLQHSFELQAIGRVDRLGQKQNTEVYCYATINTVESRILCQSVRNGTSIYLADHAEGERVVEAMQNVASSARGGGDLATNGADATGNANLLDLVL